MKAMILAAGYGKRLQPLTAKTPKPLLPVGGKPILQHHIERLASIGVTDIVINTSWLAKKIEDYFGDGTQYGVNISWSREPEPLETGGGICNALPLLGEQPFILINGDIWTDFPILSLADHQLTEGQSAWLVMVENPQHNPKGDFGLVDGLVSYQSEAKFTFSGISIFRPQLFKQYVTKLRSNQYFPLRDVLRLAIEAQQVAGTVYRGQWCDVGTVARYEQLRALIDN